MDENGTNPDNWTTSNAVNFSNRYSNAMNDWRRQYINNLRSSEQQLPTIMNNLQRQFR